MKRATKYILSQLENPIYTREIESIYMLLRVMDREELDSLYKFLSDYKQYCDDYYKLYYYNTPELKYRPTFVKNILDEIEEINQPPKSERKKNRTIDELLVLLKSNGDDAKSIAEELSERFAHQSYEDQKRIAKTLLLSEHREHIYMDMRIHKVWDDEFLDIIIKNWLEYDDVWCAGFIIEYADEEFLWEHREELSEYTGYYTDLCLRIGNRPGFTIDRDKIHYHWEYHKLLISLGREVKPQAIMEEFYTHIKDAILDTSKSRLIVCDALSNCDEETSYVSFKLLPIIREALWEINDLGVKDEMLDFYVWESRVRERLEEILDDMYGDEANDVSLEERWALYCEIAKQNFPEKYAHLLPSETPDKQTLQNREFLKPQVQELLQELDLGVIE